MRITRSLLISAVVLGASSLLGQESGQARLPKTKLEAFEAQAGTVIIRGFSKAGEMRGVYGGVLTVESMEIADATTGKKAYGIAIDVKETDRLERSNRSFIDYDEVPAFLKGIDYVSKIDTSVTKLDSFQADFRTKGDFEISIFNTPKETMASVASGSIGKTSMFLTLGDVAKFREIVASAMATLDSVKTAK